MKNIISLTLLLFSAYGFAQNLSETDKLCTTAKLWGFLKYYHPEVAKGKFDWDQHLFAIIEKTRPATNQAELSAIYEKWLDGLGTVRYCKACSKPSSKKYTNTNFDLSWTRNHGLFSESLSTKLQFLEQNRHIGKSHYFATHGRIGNIEFKNEKVYSVEVWNDRNLRLLSLFRFWNQVEYFSPNKYLADQNWDDALREMIPVFEDADSEQKLHLAMLELVTKTDDSHAGINTNQTNHYFGLYWIAADFKIIDDRAVITAFHDAEKAQEDDLRIGDVIEKVDGRSVSDIMKERDRYLPASNPAVKKRRRYAFLNGQTASAEILYTRNGVTAKKTVTRYLSSELNDPTNTGAKWKILDGNVGYVNMGRIDMQDVDAIWDDFHAMKAIIFDVRNYPKGTLYMLAKKLMPSTEFVTFTQPDPDYPGKFYSSKTLKAGNGKQQHFSGKVILLVNEMTQSHAEFTVMALQHAPNSVTIGSQTAGADGNVSEATFPSGTTSFITGLGVLYPDGTETQRKGVKIDIHVEPTIAGIASGHDEILEKALEIALEKPHKN